MQHSLSAPPSASFTPRRGSCTALRRTSRPCLSTTTSSLSACPSPSPRLNHAELASLLARKTDAISDNTTQQVTAAAPVAAVSSAFAKTTLSRSSFLNAPIPMASITRILVMVQPQNLLRNVVRNGRWPLLSGPISLLLFLLGMALAAFAAVRAALIRRGRTCTTCRGYGITRCSLCAGQGKVDWRAKFNYSDSCPLCMSKRFVECSDCGGHYHRPLFSHARRSDDGLAAQQ